MREELELQGNPEPKKAPKPKENSGLMDELKLQGNPEPKNAPKPKESSGLMEELELQVNSESENAVAGPQTEATKRKVGEPEPIELLEPQAGVLKMQTGKRNRFPNYKFST